MHTPKRYQTEMLNKMLEHGSGIVAMEPGLGKTFTTLLAMQQLGGRWLVTAPLSVIETAWMKDAAMFPDLGVVNLRRRTGAQVEQALRANDWNVGVINPEALRPRFEAAADLKLDGLVFDESSKLANPKAKLTKGFYTLATALPHKFLLSGNPAPNGPEQLFTQVQMVSNGRAFRIGNKPRSYYSFLNRYFMQKKAVIKSRRVPVGRPKLKKKYADEFWGIVNRWMWALRKVDCDELDLPEHVESVRMVDLSPKEKRAYTLAREAALVEIAGKLTDVTNEAKMMKMRQATNGFIYAEGAVEEFGSTKLKELKAVLEELGREQVLVWGSFRHEIDRYAEALGAVKVRGGMSQDARMSSLRRFLDGDVRVLIGHPGAMGHGTDGLQRVCHHQVFASLDFSWDTHKQSRDRLHRLDARAKHVFYHYLIARDTIDENLLSAMQRKKSRTEVMMEILRG